MRLLLHQTTAGFSEGRSPFLLSSVLPLFSLYHPKAIPNPNL
jgi:hypothetical protein